MKHFTLAFCSGICFGIAYDAFHYGPNIAKVIGALMISIIFGVAWVFCKDRK